jgi:hypothetical protein
MPSFTHWIRVLNGFATSCRQVSFWSARVARDGLRVKAPVQRVRVILLAEAAHGELAHGGVFAVVRQALNYGEAWSAVGACDEEVLVPVVFRISEFAQAIVAYGDVWRDNGA